MNSVDFLVLFVVVQIVVTVSVVRPHPIDKHRFFKKFLDPRFRNSFI